MYCVPLMEQHCCVLHVICPAARKTCGFVGFVGHGAYRGCSKWISYWSFGEKADFNSSIRMGDALSISELYNLVSNRKRFDTLYYWTSPILMLFIDPILTLCTTFCTTLCLEQPGICGKIWKFLKMSTMLRFRRPWIVVAPSDSGRQHFLWWTMEKLDIVLLTFLP